MKKFNELVAESAKNITEIFPWDLEERLNENPSLLLLDIREPYEFEAMHIKNSLNVPRGVLETACEWDYEETVAQLVESRDKEIVVACRSGNRSVFVCDVMQHLGYKNVASLKTGLRGWSDYDQALFDDNEKEVDEDTVIEYFTANIRPDQMSHN